MKVCHVKSHKLFKHNTGLRFSIFYFLFLFFFIDNIIEYNRDYTSQCILLINNWICQQTVTKLNTLRLTSFNISSFLSVSLSSDVGIQSLVVTSALPDHPYLYFGLWNGTRIFSLHLQNMKKKTQTEWDVRITSPV